jgi:hypothetical protein
MSATVEGTRREAYMRTIINAAAIFIIMSGSAWAKCTTELSGPWVFQIDAIEGVVAQCRGSFQENGKFDSSDCIASLTNPVDVRMKFDDDKLLQDKWYN